MKSRAGQPTFKVNDRGDFELNYNYRTLEGDAIPVFMSDSDFHDGGTNSKGSKITAKLGIGKNTSIGATYITSKVDSGSKKDFNLWQIDFETKF